MAFMNRSLALLTISLALLAAPEVAEAQYKNGQFGFEGGYNFMQGDVGLDEHSFLVGMRGAYKSSDHWWFTARALLSFRGEQSLSQKTAVLFHLVPVAARYYFLTDSFRPFVGISNSFQFLFNKTVDQTVLWGPGATVGAEFKLKRDLFLGVQADAYWMFVFEGPVAPGVPFVSLTAQVIFFL